MPRAAMTVTQRPLATATTPVTDLATLAAFDNTDGMTVLVDGGTELFFQNPTVGAITVTLHSAADPYGRTKDVTAHSIAASAFLVTAEFPAVGWNSGGGNLMNVDASATGLLYAAIQRAPGT